MPATISCVTFAVDDLQRALTFYRDGLGLPAEGVEITEDSDHIPLLLPGGVYLVLTLRAGFGEFTDMVGHTVAVRGASECILSYFASSKDEVDAILARIPGAGGVVAGPPKDQQWGYAALVTDPDGHIWEVMWNPQLVSELPS